MTGERILGQELGARAAWHLANIVVTYRLSDESIAVLNTRSSAELAELIVDGVRDQVSARKGAGR